MKVVFIRGADLDMNRTCNFVVAALKARSRMIDRKSLCGQIRELTETGLIKVAAYEGKDLAGLILLDTQKDEWQINPGILGGHPLIAPGHDVRAVSQNLLDAVDECAREKAARKLRLTAIRRPEECGDRADHGFYEEKGYRNELSYVEMNCKVEKNLPAPIDLPEGYSLKLLESTQPEELFPIYQAAFEHGEARFYFLQDESERRDYFHTLGWDEAHPLTSHLIEWNAKPVAFSLVLPFSLRSYHISCMCVHPDHQRLRLGEAMLIHILRSAAAADVPIISLGTEPEMRACCLYTKYGFEIRGGSSFYVKDLHPEANL